MTYVYDSTLAYDAAVEYDGVSAQAPAVVSDDSDAIAFVQANRWRMAEIRKRRLEQEAARETQDSPLAEPVEVETPPITRPLEPVSEVDISGIVRAIVEKIEQPTPVIQKPETPVPYFPSDFGESLTEPVPRLSLKRDRGISLTADELQAIMEIIEYEESI